MLIKNINLLNFRNYSILNLQPKNIINVLIGDNAQGKTNLIEAINFISLGRSQRAKDIDLIRWNQPQAIIFLNYQKLGVNQSISIEINRDKSRRIIMNDQPIKFKQLIGRFNTVLFTPEDLFLIKGSPANRRKFLDAEISQASQIYFDDLLTYNKILAQRNSLLKLIKDGQANSNNLFLWNEQLSTYAVKLILKRIQSINKLSRIANNLQKNISSAKEDLSIVYEIHGFNETLPQNLTDWFMSMLIANQKLDIIRGTTTFGPHLDDIKFLINNYDLRLYGSQGQQRTSVLALKLSEVEFLKEETFDYPILLLDDVMSELDSNRRKHLLNFLYQQKIQTFITATDSAYFPVNVQADFFNVINGSISLV